MDLESEVLCMAEIVYVAINARIMDIKIGRTDKDDVSERMKELYNTSVAVPFDCAYACVVENNEKVEQFMHKKFEKHRVSSRREFFNMNPKKAILALKAFEVEDVTPQTRAILDSSLTEQDKDERWKARTKKEKENPEWAELKDLHYKV
jgi:hypothetical protein